LKKASAGVRAAGSRIQQTATKEHRIGELIAEFFVRTGYFAGRNRKIPDAVIATIREAGYRDLGIQTELYGDGLMILESRHRHQPPQEGQPGIQHHSLIMGSGAIQLRAHAYRRQMRPSATRTGRDRAQEQPFYR
jgi:acyl-CoA hydrolase